MSVDDRIRDGLNANATAHQPAVETSLDAVRAPRSTSDAPPAWSWRRGWRPLRLPRSWSSPGPDFQDRTLPPHRRCPRRRRRPRCSAATSPTSRVPVRLAGRWVLELDGNGTVAVTPPDGYAGVVSGTLFTADGTSLRINLFAQDVCADLGNGEFSWTRDGGRLVLEVSDEPCDAGAGSSPRTLAVRRPSDAQS